MEARPGTSGKDGAAPVFLISLKAGGFGLNLTDADYCILLDPWWNPATEAQAVDRDAGHGGQDCRRHPASRAERVAFMVTGCPSEGGEMTEQQPYEVVARRPEFELRRYRAHMVAEIEVEGEFEQAANRAFGPLAGFISGGNRSHSRIAMTAPVIQEAADPEKTASTVPVVSQEDGRPGSYLVRFVMPDGFTAETLPAPEDARVRTREIPEQMAAAVRFSGRWTREAFQARAAALHKAVVAAGFRPNGPVRYARFNPPWTPWFLRRNEVVLPIEG